MKKENVLTFMKNRKKCSEEKKVFDELRFNANKLRFNARSLDKDFNSSLPSDLKKTMCSLHLKNIFQGLEKMDELLPACDEETKVTFRNESDLNQLTEKIRKEAHWLNMLLTNHETLNNASTTCRIIHRTLVARTKKFEELYN